MEILLKVAVVDDHELLRKGLIMQLEGVNNLGTISEFENGKMFVDSLEKQYFDIVFMDINMPVMNGIEATREAVQRQPGIKVIALTLENDAESLQNMLDAGAMGFLLKNVSKIIIEKAMLSVLKGNKYFSEEMMEILANKFMNPAKKGEEVKFTRRELEILELICKGMKSSEIGEKLFLSPRTIEGHRTKIMTKAEVTSTVNLILYAFKNKLVKPE